MIEMSIPEFDKEKFENVLLFFLEHSNNALLGKTKLMKLFYFLDFSFYQKYEKSITGAMYVHFKYGPIPSEGDTTLKELLKKKMITCVETRRGGYPQKRYLAKEPFNEDLFNSDEIVFMWATVMKYDQYTAKEIEELSHQEPPWIATKQGEYINYHLAKYRSPSDLAHVKKLKKIVDKLDITDLITHTDGFQDEIQKSLDSTRKGKLLKFEEVFNK
jgi:uncharacterized phage-associated protein